MFSKCLVDVRIAEKCSVADAVADNRAPGTETSAGLVRLANALGGMMNGPEMVPETLDSLHCVFYLYAQCVCAVLRPVQLLQKPS